MHPLIGALQRHIVDENAGIQAERSVGWIHPSAVAKADWCPRASWFEMTGAEAIPESLHHRLASIFAEGHEIHRKYQRWFRDMGILYGWWRCLSCDYRTWATSPKTCDFCQGEHLAYAEVPVRDEDLMIDGAGDALVEFDGLRLIEIKSIGLRTIELEYPKLYRPYATGNATLNDLWASIKSPFPVHIRQAALYFYVLREMGFEVVDIIFIYEFKANQAVKAFTVGYDDSLVRPMLRGIREVVDAVETRRNVRRPEWAAPTNKTCAACPYRKTCWESFNDE